MTADVATHRTFAELWAGQVRSRPDDVFLVFERLDGSTSTWTYGTFGDVVERASGFLGARGVRPGDAVHIALANSPAIVALWLAAISSGAWAVFSDPNATTAELSAQIDRTAPLVGFCGAARAETYPSGTSFVEVDEDDCDLSWLGSDRRPPVESSLTARAAVMFTSGTTGAPKGVVITQANYAFAGATMANASNLEARHRQLVVLPMFHANAQYYSVASAIAVGASVALMPRFSASRFCEQAARHAATHASLFAAPVRMILARRPADPPRVELEHCWYAMNLTSDEHQRLSALVGCSPRQLYGMTETIPAVLTDTASPTRPDRLGSPTDGCLVDLTGATEGEIIVGGERGLSLFAEYLDDSTATETAFVDGWFRTGDRAHRDSDGNYFFEGRRSDVLKVSGENVSTVEIELVLTAHPGVHEAAVVGVPDPVRDEVPVAHVVPADPQHPPSVADLDQWCQERLSKPKRPTAYSVVDQLPRTSVGKIQKHKLRA